MSKVIVITGTRKGIGKMLAEHFLNNGDIVYGCSRRGASIKHTNYQHFNLDVSDENSVKRMVRKIYLDRRIIDVLINNAGIASMNHFLLTSFNTTQRVMETNFFGTFLFCREVSKIMINNKKGRIINFSTVAVPLNLEGELIYSASKSAVEQLTKVLSSELGQYNITVNALGPTPIQTDLIINIPKDKINNIIERQSIKRIGVFEDVINLIEFFMRDSSSFITGQIVYLGGIN